MTSSALCYYFLYGALCKTVSHCVKSTLWLQTNLTRYVEKILECIVFSGLQCPLVMCKVFCALKHSALKHFPGEKQET